MAGGASDGPEVGRGWGGHTGEKIGIFADYLPLFPRASQRSSERVYIDAFAGTTENTLAGDRRVLRGLGGDRFGR